MKSFSLSRIPWATLGRQEAFSEISAKAEAQKPRVRLMTRQPLFTIVTQATGVTSPLLESLLAQSYSFWELIVVGSAPVHSDMRVRQTSARGDSEGECFETGRRQAKGDWVGFLSPNEILSPAALFTFATEAERQPVRDVLYSHEVHLSTDYSHIDRFYSKGEYSWFNLIHFNCLGRGWFIRCSTLEKVNFEPEAFEADLFLKISEETENWGLIPSYLCYRRGVDPKSLERDGSHLFAVGSHIARRRYSGTAVVRGGRTLVTPLKEKSHLISVIICFRNKAEWTIQCLRSLAGVHSRSPLQVVLLNNRSDHEARARVKVEAVTLGLDFEFVDDAREFNFGQMHNDAVARVARGDILFFLNNDAFLDETVSLDDMVAWTAQDGIGVVGMALRYPDGRPQHTGFQATYGGENRMARVGHDHSQNIFAGLRREVFGNTFAAAMMKRSVFETLGGLRAVEFPNGFGDVAFNFDCHRRGLHNLYLGDITGTHRESASRGLSYEYWEEVAIETEYPDILQKMLRADVGFDRIPRPDFSFRQLKEIFVAALYRTFPRLLALRPAIRRLIASSRPPLALPSLTSTGE